MLQHGNNYCHDCYFDFPNIFLWPFVGYSFHPSNLQKLANRNANHATQFFQQVKHPQRQFLKHPNTSWYIHAKHEVFWLEARHLSNNHVIHPWQHIIEHITPLKNKNHFRVRIQHFCPEHKNQDAQIMHHSKNIISNISKTLQNECSQQLLR